MCSAKIYLRYVSRSEGWSISPHWPFLPSPLYCIVHKFFFCPLLTITRCIDSFYRKFRVCQKKALKPTTTYHPWPVSWKFGILRHIFNIKNPTEHRKVPWKRACLEDRTLHLANERSLHHLQLWRLCRHKARHVMNNRHRNSTRRKFSVPALEGAKKLEVPSQASSIKLWIRFQSTYFMLKKLLFSSYYMLKYLLHRRFLVFINPAQWFKRNRPNQKNR